MQLSYIPGAFRIWRLGPCLIGSLLLMTPPAPAQTFTPYSTFDDLTLAQLTTLQVKLTYVGIQGKATVSALSSETSNSPDITVFVPFRRPGIDYSNDEITPQTYQTTATELQQMLNNVATLPDVVTGGVLTPNYLAFGLHSTHQGGIAFESILDPTNSGPLFDQIRAAFASNVSALAAINRLGCAIAANPAGLAEDVTASLSLRLSGVRLDRATGLFVGSLTATNTSGNAINGPISVAMTFPATIRLSVAQGSTCKHAPAGRQYIDLPVSGSLGSGESVEVTFQLDNPDREQIVAGFQVLAGTGSR